MRDSVRLGVVALGAVLGLGVSSEARAAEPPEGRLGSLQLGLRAGVGGAHVRTADVNINGDGASIPYAVLVRIGVRPMAEVSLSVEGGALGLFPLPNTVTTEARPPRPPGIPRYPFLLGVVSGTVGLPLMRYLELSIGPTVGGGPTLVGGGTLRLAVRIPTRARVVLTPGLDGFLLSGDRTGYGAIFGTFGFEL